MREPIERSDLLDWTHHEHEHLSKLFDDLRATFNRLALGDVESAEREEMLGQAMEDLEGALEDMLEHFNEEEEVYFLAIEQRFPEFGEAIAELVSAHESICTSTRRLRRHIAGAALPSEGGIEAMSAALIAMVNELARDVERHNAAEHAVFSQALRQLSPHERIAIMDRKRALG